MFVGSAHRLVLATCHIGWCLRGGQRGSGAAGQRGDYALTACPVNRCAGLVGGGHPREPAALPTLCCSGRRGSEPAAAVFLAHDCRVHAYWYARERTAEAAAASNSTKTKLSKLTYLVTHRPIADFFAELLLFPQPHRSQRRAHQV